MKNTASSGRRELAQLLTIVRNHPALPASMLDGIDNLLSEALPVVEMYEHSETVELFIAGHAEIDRRNQTEAI